jgi:hypothetical protein
MRREISASQFKAALLWLDRDGPSLEAIARTPGRDWCHRWLRESATLGATFWSASLPSTVRPDRPPNPAPVTATTTSSGPATAPLDLTDFKRDLSELTDRLGHAQDCL